VPLAELAPMAMKMSTFPFANTPHHNVRRHCSAHLTRGELVQVLIEASNKGIRVTLVLSGSAEDPAILMTREGTRFGRLCVR
jgi:hypothetical protein